MALQGVCLCVCMHVCMCVRVHVCDVVAVGAEAAERVGQKGGRLEIMAFTHR